MDWRLSDSVPDLRYRLRVVAVWSQFVAAQLRASREMHLAPAWWAFLLPPPKESLVQRVTVQYALLEPHL